MYAVVQAESMSVTSQLIEGAMEMPVFLQRIAENDPVAAALLGVGSLLIAVCVGSLVYFGAGAAIDLVSPSPS